MGHRFASRRVDTQQHKRNRGFGIDAAGLVVALAFIAMLGLLVVRILQPELLVGRLATLSSPALSAVLLGAGLLYVVRSSRRGPVDSLVPRPVRLRQPHRESLSPRVGVGSRLLIRGVSVGVDWSYGILPVVLVDTLPVLRRHAA